MSFSIKVTMTYSPTNLFTGSTIPAAIGHAQCGKVTPRGSRLAGIVKCSKSPRLRRGINSIHKKKRTSALTEVLFVKSGDDLLSHKAARRAGSSMATAVSHA